MIAINRKLAEQSLETGEPEFLDQEAAQQKHIVAGSFWMLGVTMALFFFPVVNGIIGGVIGGYKVGSTKNAIMASILPAIAAGFLLWIVLTLANLSIMGPVEGPQLALLIFLSDLGLLIGAGIGGTISQNKIDRLNRA